VSTLTTDRIRETATKLGLTHLTDVVTELVERAEAAQMGYLDFVDLLLEEELGLGEGRRFRNALKLSGLPHHKTLDEFDFAFQPELDARKVRDLATLEFVRAKSNVALLGPPGVGKTMIAVAVAVAACQAGFSIYFTTLDDLVRRLRTAEATGRFNRQLGAYLRPAVLVVDEVGYLPLDRAARRTPGDAHPRQAVAWLRQEDNRGCAPRPGDHRPARQQLHRSLTPGKCSLKLKTNVEVLATKDRQVSRFG